MATDIQRRHAELPPATRRHAGVLMIVLPAVIYVGVSILRLLILGVGLVRSPASR